MVDMDPFVDAIVDDQYPWGEFGRSEEASASPRTAEIASWKPHVWVSLQAAYALTAVTGPDHPSVVRFEQWVMAERAHDGWWTSRAGAQDPRGQTTPTQVHNLRHTAKGLDLLACKGSLSASDVPIIHAILNASHQDGSWPAHHYGPSEIWATAYVVNLIARLLHRDPGWLGISEATLRSRLDGGLAWLVECRTNGMWTSSGQDPVFTTEAVLAEIGALLAQRRPDVCREVASALLRRLDQTRRPTAAWGLALTWGALDADAQLKVIQHARSVVAEVPSGDVVDRACAARLAKLDADVATASWYGSQAGGHESALPTWARWDTSDYHDWCLRRAREPDERAGSQEAPRDQAEAWQAATELLTGWAAHVEEHWRGLWDGDVHVDEAKLQASFKAYAAGARVLDRAVFPEVDTGRGAVDFVFVNGTHATVYIEFKRGDHGNLDHGAQVQLPTYVRSAGADAGLLVCVGFSDDDLAAAEQLTPLVESLDDELFIRVIVVDGRRKPSASKA